MKDSFRFFESDTWAWAIRNSSSYTFHQELFEDSSSSASEMGTWQVGIDKSLCLPRTSWASCSIRSELSLTTWREGDPAVKMAKSSAESPSQDSGFGRKAALVGANLKRWSALSRAVPSPRPDMAYRASGGLVFMFSTIQFEVFASEV